MRPTNFAPTTKSQLSNFFRRCRCYTCQANPAEAAILRRPTRTSRLAPWRRLTTLFYSSLITAAAAADVEVKKKRREQWQTAIAAAEEDLQRGQTQSHESDDGTLYKVEETAQHGLSSVEHRDDHSEHEAPHALAKVLQRFGISLAPVPWGLLGRDVGPESLYASDERRKMPRRWTPKKLATLELAVAKLALRLWMDIPDLTSTGSLDAVELVDLVQALEDVKKKLAHISTQDPLRLDQPFRVNAPKYSPSGQSDDPGTRELNKSILQMTKACDQGEVSLSNMLARVVKCLLSSQSPPERTTMSILLEYFASHGHYHLAAAVCECIEDSHIRLDEVAVNTILDYYIRANDKEGFGRFRLKMEGYYGGLALANPYVRISWRRSKDRLRRYDGKVFQGLELDSVLWHTLLRGHILFRQTPLSIKTFYKMTEAGFKTELPELNDLLYQATMDHDWNRGIEFWNTIDLQWMPRDPLTPLQPHSSYCSAFRRVLKLCRCCQKWDEFNDLFRRAVRHGLSPAVLGVGKSLNKVTRSPAVSKLARNVRIVARKAEINEILFHHRARLVIRTQMRLAGHATSHIRELFARVADPESTFETQCMDKTFDEYWQRLRSARRITETYFGINTSEPNLDTEHAAEKWNENTPIALALPAGEINDSTSIDDTDTRREQGFRSDPTTQNYLLPVPVHQDEPLPNLEDINRASSLVASYG